MGFESGANEIQRLFMQTRLDEDGMLLVWACMKIGSDIMDKNHF
jgi:hypothetical protein